MPLPVGSVFISLAQPSTGGQILATAPVPQPATTQPGQLAPVPGTNGTPAFTPGKITPTCWVSTGTGQQIPALDYTIPVNIWGRVDQFGNPIGNYLGIPAGDDPSAWAQYYAASYPLAGPWHSFGPQPSLNVWTAGQGSGATGPVPCPPKPPTPTPTLPPSGGCIQVEICNWPQQLQPTPTPTPTPTPQPPTSPPPAKQPVAPAPIPLAPEACQGITFPLGFPRVGSEDWCKVQDTIISTVRSWGTMLLDWLIKWADRIETYGWDGAHEAAAQQDLDNQALQNTSSGLFGALGDWIKSIQLTLDWIWQGIKKGISYAVFGLAYGTKALLCMLRNAQSAPGYVDYLTATEIWVVRYAWNTLRKIRLSSPDFLGVQTVGADVEDWFDGILTFLEHTVTQKEPPSEADAMEAWLNNRISQVQFECWMNLNDTNADVWRPVLDARREQLTTDERIEFIRRQTLGRYGTSAQAAGITLPEEKQEEEWVKLSAEDLRNVGWLYEDEAKNREALYDELPTIADHLHWLARNVDDEAYVRDYHLLDGFDNPLTVSSMVAAEGVPYTPIPLDRNFWKTFGVELRAQGMRKIDAARHYAAHWLHPSPIQMHEFIYRLRPGREPSEWDKFVQEYFAGKGYPPDLVARLTTFTPDDFRRIMSEQDYGYLDVGWFLSTIYHVPALSYIRDMYRYGTIDEDGLKGYHQDLGYSETDSVRFVDVDRKIKKRIRAQESYGWGPSALSRALGLGLIDDQYDADQMAAMGFNADEISSHQSRAKVMVRERVLMRAMSRIITRTITQVSTSYGMGALTKLGAAQALTSLGVQPQQAVAMLDVEELKFDTGLLRQTIAKIRTQFYKGRINAIAAVELLTQAGMQQPFVDRTVVSWNLTLAQSQREISAADVKKLLKEGIINATEAALRLENLGYSPVDTELLMADIAYQLEQAQLKQQEAAAKQAAAAAAKTLSAEEKATLAAQRAEQRAIAQAQRQAAAAQTAAQRLAAAAARQAKQAQTALTQQIKQAKALLMKEASPADLVKQLGLQIVNLEDVRGMLTEYGWSQPYIDNFIMEKLGVNTLAGVQ